MITFRKAVLRRLALRCLALTALVCTTTTCGKEAPPKPRWNVLLITVDTLRADRVGGARGTTPWIDAHLAADGVSFTRASTPRTKTTPALASLLTGLYPHEHGVRDLMEPLALGVPTLAERLRAAGYRTGAIVGNYVLQDKFSGLARGFEQWTEDLPDKMGVPPDDVPQRTARSLARGAARALGVKVAADAPADGGAGPASALARKDEPWFLWLHFMDPHGRYEPPAEFRTFRGASEPISTATPPGEGVRRKRFVAQFNVPDEAKLADGQIDAGRVKDLYDGEVLYVDTVLKELFAQLGPLENTLVVFTADHGEAFGEHEVWFEHGQDAYEETAHVPLVVRFPNDERARPKGIRSDAEISLCDIAPTILEYVGVAPLHPNSESGATVRGRSRLNTWYGAPSEPSCVFIERVDRTAGTQYKAARLGDWKLVRRYAQTVRTGSKDKEMKPALRGEELYDLATDPNEQRDLSAAPPKDAPLARLRADLDRFTALDARFGALGPKPKTARTAEEEAEHQRQLDNLGYGGGSDEGEPAPPKSPEKQPEPAPAPKPGSQPAPPEKKPD